jgi:hypothetical protein
MKTLVLTRGLTTQIDDEDFEWLSRFKWSASFGQTSGPYAVRGVRISGKSQLIMMHREILAPSSGMQVDHINRDPLDNRRVNLRLATAGQNYANGSRALPRSGFRGVEYQPHGKNKFTVRTFIDGKRVYLGSFATLEEAAQVASKHRVRRFGDFAAPEFLVR